MSHTELCFMTATELVRRIRTRELSCKEVMEAHLTQIERINPVVNAIVTHVSHEQIMSRVQAADEAIVRGQEVGPLHGLPIAHKDLVPTKNLRTTW
jgi:amidase